MPKMRERCASLSGSRADCGRRPRASRDPVSFLLAAALLVLGLASAAPAHAAARRIVLIHPEPALTRSVDLALYPWDITVLEISDAPPEASSPDAAAGARAIAKHHDADAIAWIDRTDDSTTLWFFDASDGSLRSHPLPSSPHPESDAAMLAAVALTLKTLVRATPWESRIPTVVRERKGTGWESRLELDALARVPVSGASGEPRLGLWISEWYGTPSVMWGAALGTSAGLGMTYDAASSHGTLQDIDARGAIRARVRLGRHFVLEPSMGASAHFERAEVTTTVPAATQSFTRFNPSADVGLTFGWRVSEVFTWSVGGEALESLRYQRWLEGGEVVFAPSSLWIQGGTSIAWTFR
jgi:hypothetical protein